MELALLRYFWVALIFVTCLNGRTWWKQAQSRIQSQPDLEPGYRRLYRGYLFWTNLPWLAMGLGILSGEVPTVFDFLNPSGGNPFVLAWWGLMAATLLLGTYWMLVGGGVEMLERHPGVHMVPRWTAPKLRIFWLGVVAWNVGIGTLIFLGFPGVRPQQVRAPFQGSWFPVLFPLFFVATWLFVSFLLSAIGGWGSLAVHYASTSPFSGRRFHFRSAQLGGVVNYGSCLTVGAEPNGLYLAVLPFFRFGHPALLIPWSDITAREARRWLFAAIELRFAKTPGVSLRFSRRLAQALFDASGTQVPVEPAA